MCVNICLLGFGTVGSSVYKLIQSRNEQLTKLLGQTVKVTHLIIKNEEVKRDVEASIKLSKDFKSALENGDIDLVVEAIVGVEPAFSYLKKALEKGIPVITANKEMFAQKGVELRELAAENNTIIGYEATVAGGVPIIRTLTDLLHINKITKIEGILNGTSNFILSDMRTHQRPFKESLKLAQDHGYAEADPTNDIQGYDAFYKLMILCEDAFKNQPEWTLVKRVGIDRISIEEIHKAAVQGGRIKLVAEAVLKSDGSIEASVAPRFVDKNHPLYGVEDVENAVTLHTDLLGALTLKGPGAGGHPTASAILEDLSRIILDGGIQTSKPLQTKILSI